FFNLRKAKSRISALDEGDMRPIKANSSRSGWAAPSARGSTWTGGLAGAAWSTTATPRESDSPNGRACLVRDPPDQETRLAASEEFDNRRRALAVALGALKPRARRIFEGRRLAEDPMTLAELANEFGVSRERVRQIEARAFEKVQKIMNRVATIETPAQKPMH